MCRAQVEQLFYLCGYINNFELPSLNSNCDAVEIVKRWNVTTKFPQCEGLRSGWAQVTLEGIPCKCYTGQATTIYSLHDEPYTKYTQPEIWQRRKAFLVKVHAHCAENRRGFEQEVFQDEYLKGVSRIEQTYFVDSTEAVNPIIRAVPKSELPDSQEECAICKGILAKDGDEGCESTQAGRLPCEHIFGYNCIRQLIYDNRYNRCPLCSQGFNIHRTLDKICHTGDFKIDETRVMQQLRDAVFGNKVNLHT